MAKPSETQTQLLLRSKARVISRMKEFEAWVSLPFLSLLLNVFVLSFSCLVFVFVKIQIQSKS